MSLNVNLCLTCAGLTERFAGLGGALRDAGDAVRVAFGGESADAAIVILMLLWRCEKINNLLGRNPMLKANKRKMKLSGWLKENHAEAYKSHTKIQGFLLFYEAFSEMDGELADFSHIKGDKQGIVFETVWEDYTMEWEHFDQAIEVCHYPGPRLLDEVRAEKCVWIVGKRSEDEVLGLMRQMNLWKAKKRRIMRRKGPVDLDPADFNGEDRELMRRLEGEADMWAAKKGEM